MKKRMLSILMAVCMMLTAFPSAVDAEEQHLQIIDEEQQPQTEPQPKSESQPQPKSEPKSEPKSSAAAQVQKWIDTLPSPDELAELDDDALYDAFTDIQKTYDAFAALCDEEKEQVTGTDRLQELYQLLYSYDLSPYDGETDCTHESLVPVDSEYEPYYQCSQCDERIMAALSYRIGSQNYTERHLEMIAAMERMKTLSGAENIRLELLCSNTDSLSSSVNYSFPSGTYTIAAAENALPQSNGEILLFSSGAGFTVPNGADVTFDMGIGAVDCRVPITVGAASGTGTASLKVRNNGAKLENASITVNATGKLDAETAAVNGITINGGAVSIKNAICWGDSSTGSVTINALSESTMSSFTGCTFKHKVEIKDIAFKGRISFENCIFEKDLTVTDGNLIDLLPSGYAFADTNGTIKAGNVKTLTNVKMISHSCTPDTYTNGMCGCGIVCLHKNRTYDDRCINCGATIYAEYAGVYYPDFKDVIAALPDGSTPATDTIKLLNDVRYRFTPDFLYFTIGYNKGCTIDLNGFKLYGNNTIAQVLYIAGDVVVTDNSSNATKGSTGTIVIHPTDTTTPAKLQIDGDITVYHITTYAAASGVSYQLTINGGTFTNGVKIDSATTGTGTITGGVFEKALNIASSSSTFSLSGGEFKGGISVSYGNSLNNLLATGGANQFFYADANGKYLIMDDSHYMDIRNIKVCPHIHHQLTDAANYKCVCGTALAVAIIDDNVISYYASFQEAIADSDSSTTIQLIKDLAIDDIPNDNAYYNRTLDLNGFKLSKNGSGDLSIGACN